MIAHSRKLLLRIYAVSVAQLFAIAGSIALVSWLTFQPHARGGFVNDAEYAVANLALVRHAPAQLAAELARIRTLSGARVTVYDAHGVLVASSAKPGLPALSDRELAELARRGRSLRPGPPPLLALPLAEGSLRNGYAVYEPAAPPPPPPTRTIWALAIAMLGAGVASALLARSFARPLAELASAARALGEGDLTRRVRSTRGDEFGELARTFDDMADRLALLVRAQQELLANVSHELRTPLARIRVALDIAAEGEADKARAVLGDISEDLSELERIVADVLQMARLELKSGRAASALPLRRDPALDVGALLDTVVQRFRATYPSRLLTLVRPDALPTLVADPVLLRRALENLLENARAYSDADTSIELHVELGADSLSLSVIDLGIGIAEADLARVATPFFRSDPSRARRTGGLGLGLSLARRIVEAHGGELVLESTLGRGTTATLRLPLSAAGAHSLRPA